MKNYLISGFLAVLAGCATQDIVAGSSKARFGSYPTRLFNAFENACTGPEHTFRKTDGDVYECRELLPPPVTAAAILQYDGYPEDLPELVIRFIATEDVSGFLVNTELFLNVPQKEGAPLKVIPSDPRISRRMARLLEAAGGEPV